MRLPIKVVPALEGDMKRPHVAGGPAKEFREVDKAFREELESKIVGVQNHFQSSFSAFPLVPAVARLKIRKDAVAKTHRPSALFNERTCPIISSDGLDELLISVTPQGLEKLANQIRTTESKKPIAHMSSLIDIQPELPVFDLPDDQEFVKVKLFRHHMATRDSRLEEVFLKLLQQLELDGHELRYGDGLKIFKVERGRDDLLIELGTYVGTQSLGAFPSFRPLRSSSTSVREATTIDFPSPEDGVEYSVVGLVDTGIDPDDPFLSPWVVSREEFVPDELRDYSHGTFVGGLLANAKSLNHGDPRFPSCSSKIVDVIALGKDGVREDELIAILEEVIPKHPYVQAWNLSLSSPDETVKEDSFSELAVALDRLQDEHNTVVILAAGNFMPPYESWPRQSQGGFDRLTIPADSVRSIVVGSIAHTHNAASAVKAEEPSPFSRRGPGPAALVSPELSHYGGNCGLTGDYAQVGVLSLDPNGNLAEDIGTSFAAPLISTLVANVKKQVVGGASTLLTRGLILHAAAKAGGRIDQSALPYSGFGTPPDLSEIVGCEEHECTLIFELEIEQGMAFKKTEFPIPPCLYVDNDRVRAEFLMTLVYESELDAGFGSEYCRTNIDVSLGTMRQVRVKDKKTGEYGYVERLIGQVPPDDPWTGKGSESTQVEEGFKWSPKKVYRRSRVQGISGQHWRLQLDVHYRANHAPKNNAKAVLLLSISDPQKNLPVYNQMVQQMNLLGWGAVDLQIQQRLRS